MECNLLQSSISGWLCDLASVSPDSFWLVHTILSMFVSLFLPCHTIKVGYIIAYMQLVMESMLTFVPEESRNYLSVQRSIRFGFVTPLFCFIAMITSLKQLARFGTIWVTKQIVSIGIVHTKHKPSHAWPCFPFIAYIFSSEHGHFQDMIL